jgi:hypothetical protein
MLKASVEAGNGRQAKVMWRWSNQISSGKEGDSAVLSPQGRKLTRTFERTAPVSSIDEENVKRFLGRIFTFLRTVPVFQVRS